MVYIFNYFLYNFNYEVRKMNEYKLNYRLEQLKKRKLQLFRDLEWANNNNDVGLANATEIELKSVLKQISKIQKILKSIKVNC